MKDLIYIKNSTETTADLYFYGDIVSDWSGAWQDEDQYPDSIKNFLIKHSGKDLNIHINSGGGSVFAGIAIYNMLKRSGGYKRVYIDGVAASIASVIALAGDEIIMPKSSMLMIHKPWTQVQGNATDITKIANDLEEIEKSILAVYEENIKTNVSIEKIKDMLEKETWLTAEDASKYFNNITIESDLISASCKSSYFKNYSNIPKNIKVSKAEEYLDKNDTQEDKELLELMEFINSDNEYENIQENIEGSAVVGEKFKAFRNAVTTFATKKALSNEDREIINQMNTESGVNGGILIPEEVMKEIKLLKREGVSLEEYVYVVPVKTKKGKVDIFKTIPGAMMEVVEGESFQEEQGEEFSEVPYKIKKYGCIKKMSKELLIDAGERFTNILKVYGALKSRSTRNAKILACIESNFNVVKVVINNAKDLENTVAQRTGIALTLGSIVITNQKGYSWMDSIQTSDGKGFISIVDGVKLFKGLYPIVVMDDRELPSLGTNHPLIFGNLKEGIMLVDRESMSIELSENMGTDWNKDMVAMKICDRFDIKQLDDEAIIKCEINDIVQS